MPAFQDAVPTASLSPGETTPTNVDGFPVAVANTDGEYFAFQNLCPHQGARLGGRRIEDGCLIRCPRHSSRFDVRTGACVAPAPDGSDRDLMTFATRVLADMVQVEI